MTPSEAAQQILQHASAAGLSPKDCADKFNKFNPEQPIDPMTFNPDALVPPEDILNRIVNDVGYNELGIAHYFTRWGARQAVEALRHQWPEPIISRPPTAEDANETGWVQTFSEGCIDVTDFRHTNGQPWLHTPGWRPKLEPTLKERALALLDSKDFDTDFTDEQIALLRQVVESAPDTTP